MVNNIHSITSSVRTTLNVWVQVPRHAARCTHKAHWTDAQISLSHDSLHTDILPSLDGCVLRSAE